MPKIILLIICFLFGLSAMAQSEQEKLEQRKVKILEEIRAQQQLLKSKDKDQKSVLTAIAQQTEQIRLREKLINTNEKQARLLNDDLYLNQLEINKLNRELEDLRKDYANMIVKSYKSRSQQSRVMFMLSSENFLQAYKRAQYMKQYANYRKMQGEEIKVRTAKLDDYSKKLAALKAEKQKIVQEQEKERLALEQEKKEKEELVNSIKKDKKKITAEINKKQQETKAIDKKINDLIKAAIAEANRRTAEAERKANPKTTSTAKTNATINSNKIVLTPEAKILSDNFKANRGKLPWPVERGSVYLKYGDVRHPLVPSMPVHNNGVEIETDRGSNARSVFSGVVSKIYKFSPVNTMVVIQHGEFFTMYQNLTNVNVNVGDKVGLKQTLGQIHTNTGTGKTILKFMISQNTTFANPESWLHNM
jgi:septal ring factor EnvC (AmiA/AmiB activator)